MAHISQKLVNIIHLLAVSEVSTHRDPLVMQHKRYGGAWHPPSGRWPSWRSLFFATQCQITPASLRYVNFLLSEHCQECTPSRHQPMAILWFASIHILCKRLPLCDGCSNAPMFTTICVKRPFSCLTNIQTMLYSLYREVWLSNALCVLHSREGFCNHIG